MAVPGYAFSANSIERILTKAEGIKAESTRFSRTIFIRDEESPHSSRAIDVDKDVTIYELRRAADVSLSQELVWQEEVLSSDEALLSDIGVGAEATLSVQRVHDIDLTKLDAYATMADLFQEFQPRRLRFELASDSHVSPGAQYPDLKVDMMMEGVTNYKKSPPYDMEGQLISFKSTGGHAIFENGPWPSAVWNSPSHSTFLACSILEIGLRAWISG